MVPNDFNVWFTTMTLKNPVLANIIISNELKKYFENCWSAAQQTLIENEIERQKFCIIELEGEKENLECDIIDINNEKAGLEAEIQTLLSRIIFLEEQLQGK